MGDGKRYRAGSSLEDLCRPCKQVRGHRVLVVGTEDEPLRVICDYCGSQHNYRGGGARYTTRTAGPRSTPSAGRGPTTSTPVQAPFPLVGERELSGGSMSYDGNEGQDLELLLRRIIREEAGLTPATPADKWRGGEMVLRPGREGVQEKSWPIESFFHKVVMLRNRLRVLEQQINGTDLPGDTKAKLQGYITACYGSLTSFNVLFAEEEDRFKGSGKDS